MTDFPDQANLLISAADVAWAAEIMRLPPTAFTGIKGDDPRLTALRSLTTLDVEACPGSGKTTLLVAKLAILAQRWALANVGVCVLSHTNVARREIDRALGGTAAGRRFLTYPHYIGTIHSFVNAFLAIPWLRSHGHPIRMVNDEVALARRWKMLPMKTRDALEVNKHGPEVLRIADTGFGVGTVRWGKGRELGRDTETYREIKRVCRETVEEGFQCHDEMFVWANDLLDKVPTTADTIRRRFPLLFLDEVQDNSEAQSALLHRIFMAGGNPVIRQRYGDSNQAIFYGRGGSEGASTDLFPAPNGSISIPDSCRFDQTIADLANPFALSPQGLRGRGPAGREVTGAVLGKHAIFLFTEESIGKVLDAFAAYLQALFTSAELKQGAFTAVAAVHRLSELNGKIPRAIGNYWPEYDPQRAVSDPERKTFQQYVLDGQRQVQLKGEAFYAVELVAEGILHLVRIINPAASPPRRKRRHRQVLDALANMKEIHGLYERTVGRLCGAAALPDPVEWSQLWLPIVEKIAKAISGTAEWGAEADQFLAYTNSRPKEEEKPEARDNIFRHNEGSQEVQVRVGSIHSIKGETHTATIVLESFTRAYNLRALKPWLLGKRSGGEGEEPACATRMRLQYVAMTRPSHLLCLAMRADSFGPAELATLQKRGWRVAHVTKDAVAWLADLAT